MRRLFRPAAMLAASAASALVLAGCNSSPGAAAVVGGHRISTDALEKTVQRALANPQAQQQVGTDRARFMRSELGRLINDQLIDAAARDHGVSVSGAEVSRQLQNFAQQAGGLAQLQQQAASGGIPPRDLPTVIRYYVLQQKLADKLASTQQVSQQQLQAAYAQNRDTFDQVHAAHILVKTKALADRILAEVKKNPAQFAALAKQYSIDTSNKNNGGDLGFAGHSQFVPAFSDAIFKAKPGSFIEVHTKFGWHVVHVIAHRTQSLAAATPALKSEILKSRLQQLVGQALAAEAKKLGVHVNPRFGVWDPTKRTVVPANPKDAVSSPSPTP